MQLSAALERAGFQMSEIARAAIPVIPIRSHTVRHYPVTESQFSRAHAALTDGDDTRCWICLFPLFEKKAGAHLRSSMDHVIPRSLGGPNAQSNLRPAHQYCNGKRGTKELTVDIVHQCRSYLVTYHGDRISFSNFLKATGLRVKIYEQPVNASNHARAFQCPDGAD